MYNILTFMYSFVMKYHNIVLENKSEVYYWLLILTGI